MNNLKPYTKYKPTNIAWLGDIPEHWEVRKLKYLADNLNRRRIPIEASIRGNMTIRRYDYYGATGVIDKVENYIFDETTLLIAEDGANLVMRNLKLVYKATGKYWVNNHAHIISPKPITDIDYLAYYLEVFDYNPLISGSAQPKLTKDAFQNIEILFPPKGEQQTIANFLDYKLSKIDRFIQKKKQLIKLLNEQKAGIINDAVTKGLNPNTKMKPSGIEWLGDIPEHWEVKRLRFLLKPGDRGIKIGPFGSAIKSDIINGKEHFLNLGQKCYKVYGQEHPIASDFNIGVKYISEKDYAILNNYKLSSGDIVISMMGTIGKSKVVPENVEEGIMDSHLIRIGVNTEVTSEYISFLINDSVALLNNMKFESKGSIMSGLNSKIIKSLYIPLPKLDEQNIILSYTEKETAKLNQTIATIEKEIALTQEYRVALIAEAVTGKIDVRDYEIPETPIVDLYEELEDEMSLAAEEEVGYSTEN